jgi:hypothetical protein
VPCQRRVRSGPSWPSGPPRSPRRATSRGQVRRVTGVRRPATARPAGAARAPAVPSSSAMTVRDPHAYGANGVGQQLHGPPLTRAQGRCSRGERAQAAVIVRVASPGTQRPDRSAWRRGPRAAAARCARRGRPRRRVQPGRPTVRGRSGAARRAAGPPPPVPISTSRGGAASVTGSSANGSWKMSRRRPRRASDERGGRGGLRDVGRVRHDPACVASAAAACSGDGRGERVGAPQQRRVLGQPQRERLGRVHERLVAGCVALGLGVEGSASSSRLGETRWAAGRARPPR